MASIVCDNIWAYINTEDPDIITLLKNTLKHRSDGYQYTYWYKSGKWDGYTSLFDKNNMRFRRGLLPRVMDMLQKSGYEISVTYQPTRINNIKCNMIDGVIKPYEFQQKIDEIVTLNNIGIVVSPTGSGKTVCCALALNTLKCPAMVLVTDLVLLDQMQRSLQKYLTCEIGTIGDGEFDLRDVTVSTVQSLSSIIKGKSISAAEKRKDLLNHIKKIGVVITDEAHLFDADGINKIMPIFEYTPKFFGLSATPYGWDEDKEIKQNLELEQHLGKVIYDCRKLDFISMGLKSPVMVQVVRKPAINRTYIKQMKKERGKSVPDVTKNYKECIDTELIACKEYHQLIATKAQEFASLGKSVFIHASHSIKFGEDIAELIPGSRLVNGKTPRLERREIYDSIRTKESLILVSDIGGTGLDLPSLDVIILASDLKDIRQLKGRVERASPGKACGIIVDFLIDTTFLLKHHKIRLNQYKQGNHLILEE